MDVNNSKIAIILKVTDYCNFSCSFCRYAQKVNNNPRNMSFSIAKKALYDGATYNIQHGIKHLHVIFHGGEPLLWGIQKFEDIFKFQDDFLVDHSDFIFYNSIQTNAALIDERWITLFIKYNVNVGISIDGPNDLNYHEVKSGSVDVITKINLIQKSGLDYGILSVITNKHKGRAQEYYNFIEEQNIKSIGLCYCYDPIEHGSVINEVLSDFLIELFDLYFTGSYRFRIREFDCVIRRILGCATQNCAFNSRQNCGNYFSVFPDGSVHFCDAYEYKNLQLGNINNDDFYGLRGSKNYTTIVDVLHRNFTNYCLHCDLLPLCGGGCFRNDLENGKNYFCDTYKQVYKHIADVVKKYRKGD